MRRWENNTKQRVKWRNASKFFDDGSINYRHTIPGCFTLHNSLIIRDPGLLLCLDVDRSLHWPNKQHSSAVGVQQWCLQPHSGWPCHGLKLPLPEIHVFCGDKGGSVVIFNVPKLCERFQGLLCFCLDILFNVCMDLCFYVSRCLGICVCLE